MKTTRTVSGIAKALSLGAITTVICCSSAHAGHAGLSHALSHAGSNPGIGQQLQLERMELNRSLASGALTRQQATQIKGHEHQVQSNLRRAQADGTLTPLERERLQREQDRVEQKTRQALSGSQNRHGTLTGFKRSTQELKQHVNRGLASGALTRHHATEIKSHEQQVRSNLQKAQADGRLTIQERRRLQREQNRVDQKAHQALSGSQNRHGKLTGFKRTVQQLKQQIRQVFKSGTLSR